MNMRRFSWPLAALLPSLFTCPVAAAELPPQVDMSLSGIVLDDVASAKHPLGTQPNMAASDSDRPLVVFCNSDKTEKLTLTYYEGDTSYVVAELGVEKINTPYTDCLEPKEPIAHFVSGKGIRLGLGMADIVHLLGKGYQKTVQMDEMVLSYRIENKSTSGFLQRHNAPAYYSQLHFQGDKLVRFSFGFEYP